MHIYKGIGCILAFFMVAGIAIGVYRHRKKPLDTIQTMALNGVELSYLIKGPKNGKPVVLIHGNGGKHEDLTVMTDQLAEAGYLVYAPDSRGQGANKPLPEYHYSDMAEDMYQFAAKFLMKPVVFGWSDGGIIALLTEVVHPGTWTAIITSGANIHPDCGAWNLEEQRAHPSDTSALYRMMLYEPNMTVLDMHTIQCSCLIVAGENDLIKLEHTHLIGDNIPNGKVLIVPGADHGSHIYNSPVMGNIVLDYLKQINY